MSDSNTNIIPIVSAILSFLFFYLIKDYLFSTSIGLSFSIYIFLDFITKLSSIFPLKEFIIIIACIQWVIGAKISYGFGKAHHKYYMYVTEDIYMGYVVPGIIAFYLGLFVIHNRLNISEIKKHLSSNYKKNFYIAKLLIAIGLASLLISKLIRVPSLAFILYLGNIVLYTGVGYLFFIKPKYKWYIFALTLGVSLVSSLNTGMFHNLLLIGSFLGFIVFPLNSSFIYKITIVTFGVFFIYMLQIVKKDFREVIWTGKKNVNPIEVFYDLIEKEFLAEKMDENTNPIITNEEMEKQAEANNRFNQGWIISKVLENVPKRKPFLNGRTITEALEASLLPRFLAPNKAGADKGLENFKEITGLGLSENASMGLSLVAEFYANYGKYGGWLAMFIYGLLISGSIYLIVNKFGEGSPMIILWLVLFFFQVVKAETDFIKVFNHLTKSIMFFIALRFGFTFLGIKLFPSQKIEEDNNIDSIDKVEFIK